MKYSYLFLTMSLLFSSCHKAEQYTNNTPKLDYKKFLTGKLKAHAVYFDFLGREKNKFTIESEGTFNKETNRIDMKQTFTYQNGEVEQGHAYAIFNDNDFNHFTYKDHMMVKEATYEQYGNVANIKYDLKVKRGDSHIIVACDDWLHMVEKDKLAINKIKIYKFGIKVGEIVMTLIKD